MVPLIGVEPITYWLQVSCSTRWAKAANNGGERRIRTFEGRAVRFTVWSLWPLGNLTKTIILIYGGNNRTWTCDPLLVRQVLSQLSYASIKWCSEAESNHRHGDFQSPALPTELSEHLSGGSSWSRTSDHSVMSRVL